MIDPDFDPGEPWCTGLVAGIAIVLLATHLLLQLAQGVQPFPLPAILGCSSTLECLFG